MRRHALFIVALILFMAGCAASPDPRTGGFFGGVHGLATGTYDKRVQEREESLERLRALQQEMKSDEAELQASKESLEEIIRWEQEAIRELETGSAAILAELEGLESQDAEKMDEVARIRERIAGLQKDMRRQQSALDALEGEGRGNEDAELRLQQLTKQREALRQEYDMLLEMTLDLAG